MCPFRRGVAFRFPIQGLAPGRSATAALSTVHCFEVAVARLRPRRREQYAAQLLKGLRRRLYGRTPAGSFAQAIARVDATCPRIEIELCTRQALACAKPRRNPISICLARLLFDVLQLLRIPLCRTRSQPPLADGGSSRRCRPA